MRYAAITAAIILLFMAGSPAEASNWRDLPEGICSKYAAAEFDRLSPSPGLNWSVTEMDWLPVARSAGWVTSVAVRGAYVGALIVWVNDDLSNGHIAIVREVNDKGIVIEETNVGKFKGVKTYVVGGKKYRATVREGWGKPSYRSISYRELTGTNAEGLILAGYIWPVRRAEYDKNPGAYPSVTQHRWKQE